MQLAPKGPLWDRTPKLHLIYESVFRKGRRRILGDPKAFPIKRPWQQQDVQWELETVSN